MQRESSANFLNKLAKGAITSIAISSLLLFSGCGGSSDSSSSSGGGIEVTAVDGYIKDATLKDAFRLVATYIGNGKYTFSSSPIYPITLTGGKYEDTNATFDINMTAESGDIVSPITTFVENNSTLLGKLINLGLSGNPGTYSDFAVDFVDTNNTDLAKLAQLLYVAEKNATLLNAFKARLTANNPTSLNELFTLCEADINSTISTGFAQQYRVFLNKVKTLSISVSNYEKDLKIYKNDLNVDLSQTLTHNGVTYGQVISPYTGRIWLDRNLGASRVCQNLNDTACFGDYYQWGRGADGHEKVNSTTTNIQATSIDAPGYKFIIPSSNDDWLAPGIDDNGSIRMANWSKTDGSSICPVGFRVPASDEFLTFLSTQQQATVGIFRGTTPEAVFNGFLKLPTTGVRTGGNQDFAYWTGSFDNFSKFMGIGSANGVIGSMGSIQSYPGKPVRCIKAE